MYINIRIQALFLSMLLLLALPCRAAEIAGVWSGFLELPDPLKFVYTITKSSSGYSGLMDSPYEGLENLPVEVIFGDNMVKLVMPNAEFDGLMEEGKITGEFKQYGYTVPLVLERGNPGRKQDPKAPYPYNSLNVKFQNKAAKITLAGTLTYPKTGTGFPAVVLVSGSGAQNRDEEIFGHRPFWVLADYLTRQGIAVLRYDDRGVAQSGGDFVMADTKDFASDAMAAVEYLKTRKEVDPKKIGIIGHSEGGLIAFMLAAESSDIAFIVSMAGTAVDGAKIMKVQREIMAKNKGVSPDAPAFKKNEEFVARLVAVTAKYSHEEVIKNIDKLIDEELPENLRNDKETRDALALHIMTFNTRWLRFFLTYDPAEALKKIKVPALLLNGGKDVQVIADDNLETAKKYIELNGNKNVTVKKYDELNHLFQTAKTGMPDEYAYIEETMSDEVMADIDNWIKKIAK